ncbi:ATP-dependent translocase ABCB1 [Bulinus truncatus]|nr:ATP-dependent translocase ABCB1 [Bulinus truncatus]
MASLSKIKKYSHALEESKKLGIRKSVFAGLSVGLTFFIMFCAYALAFWFGSTQVNDYNKSGGSEGLSPGNVFTIFFSVMIGSFALGSASPHITSILTAKGAGGTVFSIIKDKPLIDSSSTNGKKPDKINGYIQFKDVEFSYPTRPEAKVLKKFNLDIEPGKTVALVGSSGCAQNIKLGKPDISMGEVEKAARMANAHDFISQLPKGYDTLVGERGAQLSGGQKQRVAIARALVRDPRILLLDEATSALDSESEGIVQAALDKAREGRTTVIVAHRLSTIQNADVIYVLDKGEVVEMGKHQDLMKNKGPYFSLVTLQTLTANEDTFTQEVFADEISADKPPQAIRQLSEKTPLTRQTSIHTGDKQTPTKAVNLFKSKSETPEEDQDVLKPGFIRMFKSNLKEWPFIVFGCIGAIANGLVFPVYAVFFSEIITTFGKTGQELLDQGLFWSMMFIGLGGVTLVANIVQNVAFVAFQYERLTKKVKANDIHKYSKARCWSTLTILNIQLEHLQLGLATDASMVKMQLEFVFLPLSSQSPLWEQASALLLHLVGNLLLAVLGGVPILAFAGMVNMKLLKKKSAKRLKTIRRCWKDCQ